MVFNQLDSALNELSYVVEGNDEFEFNPAKLLYEAYCFNNFPFFQKFIENGMNIKCLWDKIMKNYDFSMNKIYNRRLQYANVILFSIILILILIVRYSNSQKLKKLSLLLYI
jgi:hypothetical protein